MISRTHWTVIAVLAAIGLAAGAVWYPRLPDPAPIHWNIEGKPDGFGPRWVAAFLMPMISIGVMLLLAGLPLLGPFRRNFEQFHLTYGRICVALMITFTAMHVVFLLQAAGRDVPVGASLGFILGLMMIALGNWLGKLRRNFWIGIRTPWTIANEAVWERTHRVGGRLLMLVGAASVITALFLPRDAICFYVLIGGLIAWAGWSVLYSIYWYRRLGQTDDISTSIE